VDDKTFVRTVCHYVPARMFEASRRHPDQVLALRRRCRDGRLRLKMDVNGN
jgi:hypothetical protein